MACIKFNQEAINRGIDTVMTLSPLRRGIVSVAKSFGRAVENMPTTHEMNINFINLIRRLGRF